MMQVTPEAAIKVVVHIQSARGVSSIKLKGIRIRVHVVSDNPYIWQYMTYHHRAGVRQHLGVIAGLSAE